MTRRWTLLMALTPLSAVAADEAYEPISVVGMKGAFRLSPRQLSELVAAYQANAPRLVPTAPLRLTVSIRANIPRPADLRLRLSRDDGSDPHILPIAPDGSIALPALDYARGDYTLLADRKAGSVRIWPYVLSSGTTPSRRRLGDLRLQCTMAWPMMKDEVPAFLRPLLIAPFRSCGSQRFAVYERVERPLARAMLIDGTRTAPISVRAKDRMSYLVPSDKTLSNDARIMLAFE